MQNPVPDAPEDGHQLIYWTIKPYSDELEQHRLTYVKGPKSYQEVMGQAGNGAAWNDEWKCENRQIPGTRYFERTEETKHGPRTHGEHKLCQAGDWNVTGRADTNHLRSIFHECAENRFATFAEAHTALVARINVKIERAEIHIVRLKATLDLVAKLRESKP